MFPKGPVIKCFVIQLELSVKNWARSQSNLWLVGEQATMGFFRYIKIQFDSEASRKNTKEKNKHGHSIPFVCVL